MTAVEVLNRVLKRSPEAVSDLLLNIVPCDAAMVDDPTVAVRGLPDRPQLTGIGLLSGVLAALGHGRIAAVVGDDLRIQSFVLYTEPDTSESGE